MFKSAMIAIILVLLQIILVVGGCDFIPKSARVDFSDQVSLSIENKYFNIPIDSCAGVGRDQGYDWRLDNNCAVYIRRYWERYYNDMHEIRMADDTHLDGISRSYLFGIKSNKAFYIYWENKGSSRFGLGISGRAPCFSSDIGKLTIKLETNLPKEIISKFYPSVACKVELKEPKEITINMGDFFGAIRKSSANIKQ